MKYFQRVLQREYGIYLHLFSWLAVACLLLPDSWLEPQAAKPACRCIACACSPCYCPKSEPCQCRRTGDGRCICNRDNRCGDALCEKRDKPGAVAEAKPVTAMEIGPTFNPNTYARFMAMPYEMGVMFAVKENIPLAVCLQLEFDFPEGFSGEHVIAKLPTDHAKAAYFSRWTGDYVVLQPRDGKLYPVENQKGCKACVRGK